MAPPRRYTVEEANEALPQVRKLVDELRAEVEGLRFASEQASDLQRLHGEVVDEMPDGARKEFRTYQAEVSEGEDRVKALLSAFEEMGVEVKDPIIGLVDYRAEREDGEEVCLCWRHGEEEVAWWHPLDTGFKGRRPVSEL